MCSLQLSDDSISNIRHAPHSHATVRQRLLQAYTWFQIGTSHHHTWQSSFLLHTGGYDSSKPSPFSLRLTTNSLLHEVVAQALVIARRDSTQTTIIQLRPNSLTHTLHNLWFFLISIPRLTIAPRFFLVQSQRTINGSPTIHSSQFNTISMWFCSRDTTTIVWACNKSRGSSK